MIAFPLQQFDYFNMQRIIGHYRQYKICILQDHPGTMRSENPVYVFLPALQAFHSMNCMCIRTEQNVRCYMLYIKLEHMFAVERSDPLKLQTVVKEADIAAVRNI